MQDDVDWLAVEMWEKEMAVREAIKNRTPCIIRYSHTGSNFPWRLETVGDALWVDSFALLKDAKFFCEDNGIPFAVLGGEWLK